MDATTPKVFISHASEDTQRIAEPLAHALMENGVSVWLDRWEIKLGSNLPEEIFDHGIREANIVIAIVSEAYKQKLWPREELYVSVAQRLAGRIKIIPVLLDGTTPPVEISHLVYTKVGDTSDFSGALEEILVSIYDVSSKPALGVPPPYVPRERGVVPGLGVTESSLLAALIETALDIQQSWLQSSVTSEVASQIGLSEVAVSDALEILENRNIIRRIRTMGGGIPAIQILPNGFAVFGRFYLHDFEGTVDRAMVVIANEEAKSTDSLARSLGVSNLYAEFVLKVLKERRYVRLVEAMSMPEGIEVLDVTAEGRRRAREVGR